MCYDLYKEGRAEKPVDVSCCCLLCVSGCCSCILGVRNKEDSLFGGLLSLGLGEEDGVDLFVVVRKGDEACM